MVNVNKKHGSIRRGRITRVSYYDYILVGSGIAGLYTALLAKEQGSVLILTKSGIEECNTRHAQGGIAAPIGINDSPELHIKGYARSRKRVGAIEEAFGFWRLKLRTGLPTW